MSTSKKVRDNFHYCVSCKKKYNCPGDDDPECECPCTVMKRQEPRDLAAITCLDCCGKLEAYSKLWWNWTRTTKPL